MASPSVQPDTQTLYSSIPQYIQDWDSSNDYKLLYWLDGVGSMLQPTDFLIRDGYDNNGIGYSLLMNYPYYYNGYLDGIYYSGMANYTDVNQALAFIPWFAQFVGVSLPVIPSSVFSNQNLWISLQPYINTWIETIVYTNSFERGTVSHIKNSLATFLINYSNYGLFQTSIKSASISSGVLTYEIQTNSTNNYNVGDYATVYGFGSPAEGFANFNITKTQVIAATGPTGPTSYTFSVPTTQGATGPTGPLSATGAIGTKSLSANAFTILENTNILGGSSVTNYLGAQFVNDAYSLVVLIPKNLVPSNSYGAIFTGPTYSSYAYSTYADYPNALAAITNFLSTVIPSGITYNIVTI
jgi:hypothetical protein